MIGSFIAATPLLSLVFFASNILGTFKNPTMTASIQTKGAPAPVWQKLRFDARQAAEQEPARSSYLAATVLNHENFSDALCYQLAQKSGGPDISAMAIREIFEEAYVRDPSIVAVAERDLQAVLDRDPATRSTLQPFLFFKGYLALQTHRVGHFLWGQGRETLAFFFQSRTSSQNSGFEPMTSGF